ncbi:MAG: glycosyltransferase family 39 protein [Polyangiaceae bacterium]
MEPADRRALLLVVLLAAALRLPFLGYGLPELPWVDAFQFVGEAQRLAQGTGPFEPNDFMYPGLMKLLLASIYAFFDVVEPASMHLTARLVSATFDLGTTALLFVVARRHLSRLGAMAAASLYAVAILPIASARLETTDTMLTFFLTAALMVATRPGKLGGRYFALVAALVGLAMGAKLSGLYGGLALLAVTWLAWREGMPGWRAAGYGVAAGLLAVVVFLATTPWLIEYAEVFALATKVQAEAQRFGQIGHVQGSWVAYLSDDAFTPEQPWLPMSLGGALGPLVLVGMAAGIALALRAPRDARLLVWLGYGLLYLLLMLGAGRVQALRYLLPAFPSLALALGVAVHALATRFRARWTAGLALALLALYPLSRSVPFVVAGSRPTTNRLAEDWARTAIPPGSRVLLTPFYLENLAQLPLDVRRFRGAAQTQYRLRDSLGVDTEATPVYRPELVDQMPAAGIRYVILNSFFEASLADAPANRRYFPKTVAAYAAFRERLEEKATRVFHIDGWSEGRIGPDITVYRFD